MNFFRFFLMFFVVGLAYADETGTPLIDGEYYKSQAQFQTKLGRGAQRLLDLEAQRKEAEANAQRQAITDNEGMEAMDKYVTLIKGRYLNESGEFEPGLALDKADTANINKLFALYLRSTVLTEKMVSAGIARKTLEWGKDRLNELYKVHHSPSSSNNSEMQIIAKQVRDTEKEMKTVRQVASRMGVKLITPDPEHPEVDAEEMRLNKSYREK
jgi:hypothetical protein